MILLRRRSVATALLQPSRFRYGQKNRDPAPFCLSLSHRWSSDGSVADATTTTDNRIVSIIDNPDLVKKIPLEDVRNFCFIAHIDHGKSSLSSRVLELTGNLGRDAQLTALRAAARDVGDDGAIVDEELAVPEVTVASQKESIESLDTLSVEQERGITVKASTASMLYPHPSAVGPEGLLLLNMIDTPGHIDFQREVARSLSFVQGAVLLLDAAQGIQAQTWTVYDKASSMEYPPEMLLALTKVDLETARPIHVALAVSEWLSIDDPESILITSARNRVGIKKLLHAICERVPPPKELPLDDGGSYMNAQVVDSWFDSRGVCCIVQVLSGTLKEGSRLSIVNESSSRDKRDSHQQAYPVQEVGLVLPKTFRTGSLVRGQMGFVRFGLRDPRQAHPGTLVVDSAHAREAKRPSVLPKIDEGDLSRNSVLYASVHPSEEGGFDDLCSAVERLALNDTGLEVTKTGTGSSSSENGGPFLGPGLRVGFQGLLHVEVFRQRLLDEFDLDAVVTPPKVPYVITLLPASRNRLTEPETKVIEDLSEWPEYGTRCTIEEPMMGVRIMAPNQYTGAIIDLLTRKRAKEIVTNSVDEEIWVFEARMPWAEVVVDFHDSLKNITSGYGSLDTYAVDPPLEQADLQKVDVMLNGDKVDPLAFVSHIENAQTEARVVCKKLKEVLPRQQFVTVIQAKAGGKIIASERIQAYRKDVLVKSGKVVGGGDISRKKKLLEAQKRGKKKQQQSGRVSLSQAAFNSVISRS